MNVDTGEFRALQDKVETYWARDEVVGRLLLHMFESGLNAKQQLAAAAARPQGRHARPRRDRHGLRLVHGGGAQ